MVSPIEGHGPTTPYGKRGPYWSCDENASGEGIHTGDDIGGVPVGTRVRAMRPGTVHHVNYGSAFGSHQVAVRADDGGEDFYAHMRARVASGTRVKAGDKIGEVGDEGNVSGPHLHYERHPGTGYWNCGNISDPQKSYDHGEEDPFMGMTADDIGKAVAKHVWKDDIVPSGYPNNPEWAAGSFLKEIYAVLKQISERIDDLPAETAKHVWKDDIVPSGYPDNPEWAAGSFLKEFYTTMRQMNDRLNTIEGKIS